MFFNDMRVCSLNENKHAYDIMQTTKKQISLHVQAVANMRRVIRKQKGTDQHASLHGSFISVSYISLLRNDHLLRSLLLAYANSRHVYQSKCHRLDMAAWII